MAVFCATVNDEGASSGASHAAPTRAAEGGAGRAAERLVTRLSRVAALSAEDCEELAGLPFRLRTFAADQDIIREGGRPTECVLVVDGLVFRHKMVSDGGRQILSFHPPGDLPDLQGLHLKVMDHNVGALVASTLAFIPHAAVEELSLRRPAINSAFWRESLIQGAMFREWMVGLGRRSAFQRVAHLLCEMAVRMEAMGLGGRTGFHFAVTQTELADALGLSTVHANRVVQALRRTELVTWRSSTVTIRDWEGLREAAGFDPTYLHLAG